MAPKPGRETKKRRAKSREPFSLNVRVRRTDGAKIKRAEAAKVMHYFQKHLTVPTGYELRAVDWGSGEELKWTKDDQARLKAVIRASTGRLHPRGALVEEG